MSPTNTGLGSFTSFHCKFAMTCSLKSETESPTASDSVKHELTRIFPNGVFAARFSSKWIGLVLSVNIVKSVLSVSVTVRPRRWR